MPDLGTGPKTARMREISPAAYEVHHLDRVAREQYRLGPHRPRNDFTISLDRDGILVQTQPPNQVTDGERRRARERLTIECDSDHLRIDANRTGAARHFGIIRPCKWCSRRHMKSWLGDGPKTPPQPRGLLGSTRWGSGTMRFRAGGRFGPLNWGNAGSLTVRTPLAPVQPVRQGSPVHMDEPRARSTSGWEGASSNEPRHGQTG